MKKLLNIFFYVIMALSAVIAIYFFWDQYNEGRVGVLLYWTYILFALAIVLALVFGLFNASGNKQSIKKMAISIGFIVAVFGVSYLLASGGHTAVTAALPDPPSEFTLKLTDTGLIAAYILFAGALLAILFGAVLSTIRNR